MHRRRFLQSASALLPLTLLERAALADAAPQPHVIPNGEDRLGEHHSLGFSTILFKVLPRETAGNLLLIEHMHLQKGGGPPLHLHYAQEEYFYVMEGTFLFQVGDQRVQLHAGESVLGPRNVAHTFLCISEQPGRMLIAFTPAGQMEEYFRAAGAPNAPSDVALLSHYGVKWLGPPLTA